MTKEDKQLLLKDLCCRLHYGLYVQLTYDGDVSEQYIDFGEVSDRVGLLDADEIKPYLRHLSSMTEEEKDELVSKHIKLVFKTEDDWGDVAVDIDGFDWLNEHHFDYRGLIEKGLALEAPEGMYKTE